MAGFRSSGGRVATAVQVSANPAQTVEGEVVWDSDDDLLTVGTGSARKTLVDTDGPQTLSNKIFTAPVLTSPVLTTPEINDSSADHQYVLAVSDLAADRTITLPLLAANDIFVFAAFAQALTNKTIDADLNTISNLAHGAEVDNPVAAHGATGAVVGTTNVQTLSNKTLTSPVLTTPQINDTSLDHQYVFVASELAADRNVTLPLLTGDDEFVFKDHTQTLTNKTLTSPVLTTPQINDTSLNHQYVFVASELTADRNVTLPLLAADDEFVFRTHIQTLTNKSLTQPTIVDFTNAAHDHGDADDGGAVVPASETVSGVAEIATLAEVNTGTNNERIVSPDGLSGSVHGTKTVELVVFDFTTDVATGDGKFYFHVSIALGGMNLVEVHAQVITAGTTNTTDIQIHNVTQAADMLTTKLTIDSGETGSHTAAAAAVIDANNDDVATNDLLRVDVDAISTTAPKGLIITLGFRLP